MQHMQSKILAAHPLFHAAEAAVIGHCIIDCDAPKILEPIEIRKSRDGGPYATKTILGWAINDPLGRNANLDRTTNFFQAAHAKLHSQFKDFCNLEIDDTEYDNRRAMSKEDQRALVLMEESMKLKQGHYEVALPWKRNPL